MIIATFVTVTHHSMSWHLIESMEVSGELVHFEGPDGHIHNSSRSERPAGLILQMLKGADLGAGFRLRGFGSHGGSLAKKHAQVVQVQQT